MSTNKRKSIKRPVNNNIGLSMLNNRAQANLGAILSPIISSIGSIGSTVISSAMDNSANNEIEKRKNRIEEYNQTLSEANALSNQYNTTLDTNQDYNNQYNTVYSLGGKRTLKKQGGRDKAFVGAAIATGVTLASSILGGIFSRNAKKRALERQRRVEQYNNTVTDASNLTDTMEGTAEVNNKYQEQFNTKAKLGINRRSIVSPIITDGGDAIKVGNRTFLLRGGSHEDINESGQTGIGINIGNKEIEAEGGEVAQIKDKQLRIFSKEPILGNGISPAKAILLGADKNKVFNAQEQFKRLAGLNNDGTSRYSTPVKGISNKRSLRKLGASDYLDYWFNSQNNTTVPYVSSIMKNPEYDYAFGSTYNPFNIDEFTVNAPRIKPKPESMAKPVEIKKPEYNKGIKLNGNKSGMAITTGDWIGLGGDILGSIATGILGNKAADDISLPERPGFLQAAKLKTNYNINPQLEELNRSRRRMLSDINSGTSSSVAALNRRNLINTKISDEVNKLYGQKENVETELINKDTLNQQEVATKNLALQTDWTNKVAELENAKTNAKANAKILSLQGLGKAGANFLGQTMQRYEDIQGMRYALAASDNGTAYRMLNSGVDLDQDTIAGIFANEYNSNRANPGEWVTIDGEDAKVTAQRRKEYDRNLLNYKQRADVLNTAYSLLDSKRRKLLRNQGVLQTNW